MTTSREEVPTRRAPRWALHALWSVVVCYPVLFAVIDNRSVYGGEGARLLDATALGYLNLGFSGVAAVLSTRLVAATWRSGRGGVRGLLVGNSPDVRTLAIPLAVLIAVLGLVALGHRAVGSAMSVGLAGLVMMTLVVVSEPAQDCLERARWLFRAVVAGSLAAAIVLPVWAFVPYPHEGRALFGVGTRLIGLAPAPNYLALAAATLFFLELAAPRVSQQRHNWGWVFVALVTCGWAQGRTAYLVVLLVALFAVRWPGRERLLTGLRGTVLLGLALLSFLVPMLVVLLPLDRFPVLDRVLTGRTGAWEVAAAALADHGFAGYGPDAFDDTFWQTYASSSTGEQYGNAHNQWLDVLAGYGVLGSAALAGLVIALLIVGWRLRHEMGAVSVMALVLLFAQFPFGTPLRIMGLSWNLLTVLVVLALLAGVRAVAPSTETAVVRSRGAMAYRGSHRAGGSR